MVFPTDLFFKDAGTETQLMGPSQYKPNLDAQVYAVPKNYFNVVKSEYYVPKEYQEGLEDYGFTELESGYINPIELLYSDVDLDNYPSTIKDINDKNFNNITFTYQPNSIYEGYGATVSDTSVNGKMLVPGALEGYVGIKAGDVVKLQ